MLPVQGREYFKKLVVCIIVDVYFSMKDAYFSPVTLKGVPVIFFSQWQKEEPRDATVAIGIND